MEMDQAMGPNRLTAVAGGASDSEECLDFDRNDKLHILEPQVLEIAFASVVSSWWKLAE